MDEIEELSGELAKLTATEGGLDSARQDAVRALGQLRHHRDRSFIVRSVVSLYVAAIALLGIFLLGKGAWRGDDNSFVTLFDLIKVAVLPVVTLVIGYYFGTSKSE